MSAIPEPVGNTGDTGSRGAVPTGGDIEPMAAGVIRRVRYAVAIVVSAVIFLYVVWAFTAPPAQYSGITFFGWPMGNSLVAAAAILVGLVATTTLATVITHPDAPHTGIFCAFLSMATMAYKSGTIYLLLRHAEQPAAIGTVYQHLALECLVWAVILVAVEGCNRWLYLRFFHNTSWLLRSGDPKAIIFGAQLVPGGTIIAHMALKSAQESKHKLPPIVANIGAFVLSGVVAALILPVFMQSQLPGQTVFAAFVAFGISSALANLAFPDSSSWPLLLAVPATAAFGYLYAPTTLRWAGEAYVPSHYFSALARTLPMNYIAAGVPGAIFGFYSMLRSRMQNMLESQQNS